MPKTIPQELQQTCQEMADRAKVASAVLACVRGDVKNRWLLESAARLRQSSGCLQTENEKDLAAASEYGLTDAQMDRLRLTTDRINDIAAGLEAIANFPEPIGEVIESTIRPNGLEISRVRVPLGVVFFIYESRPNVTADAAAICVKSGNAVILRGGKEAMHSSRAIVAILRDVAEETGVPSDAVQLVQTTDRDAVGMFLKMDQQIDVAIPRGGEGLIRRVSNEATMPVIKHFAGNCHVYIDQTADIPMALQIVENSKCQRMGVCNAAESLVVHAGIASEFLPLLAKTLAKQAVEIRGDEKTCSLIPSAVSATEDDYCTEYLGPIISVAIVGTLEEAIHHINKHSSGHTEAIITQNLNAARTFTTRIDSSAVIVNASTRYNDGGEFGLGAEIGISTDKFHARGPCGITSLTSYKYIVYGEGQIRE